MAFDALGLVVATAVMGKADENLGDLLENFVIDLPIEDLQYFVADTHEKPASLLGKATSRIVYDLDRYQRIRQPAFAATLVRETHCHDTVHIGRKRLRSAVAQFPSTGQLPVQNRLEACPPASCGPSHLQKHLQRKWATANFA